MPELVGLAAIRAFKEKQAAAAAEREARKNGAKVAYLSLKDGQSVKVKFLQEMDPSGAGYNKDRGTGRGTVEHTGIGDNFKFRAKCTAEDGACWPCEQVRKAAKDSKEKKYAASQKYYINVLVDFGDGEAPQVMVLSRGLGSSFVADLMEEAEETGTITELTYKVTRRGNGTDTKYSLRAQPNDTTFDKIDLDDLEIFDIGEQVFREVPYEGNYQGPTEDRFWGQKEYFTQQAGDWNRLFKGEVSDSESSDEPDDNSATSKTMGW